MSAVISLLTTIAMLTHAVVGCCGHHCHESACETHAHVDSERDDAAHACSHSDAEHSHEAVCHHDHYSNAKSCVEHGDGEICTDAECVFVKSSLPTLNLAHMQPAVDVAPDFATADGAQQGLATRALPANSLPLRDSVVAVCAQLQVWSL